VYNRLIRLKRRKRKVETQLVDREQMKVQKEAVAVNGNQLIVLRNVTKAYDVADGKFVALKGIDMQVGAGEFVAVVGKSGSGRSTLINMITGIDNPTSGEVWVTSTPVHELDQEQLAVWRGRNVGVVFQFFQLLPTLTVAENIVLPMDFCNTFPQRERTARAMSLLEKVGIAEQADKLPTNLSGGQQQRAAIARALANDPQILVADEPTGNLDSHTSDAVMQLFADLAAEGKTVVMVTHERDLSRYFTRTIMLSDGVIISNKEQKND
jgi:putative ABC transport system ATP-binding protein